jgi:hypothetical protein
MATVWCDGCKKFVPAGKIDAIYDSAGNVSEWLCTDCKDTKKKQERDSPEYLEPAGKFPVNDEE